MNSVTSVRIGRKAFVADLAGVTHGFLSWSTSGRAVIALIPPAMAKKKKDRIKIHKEARRLARRGLGMPPTERTIPDKRDKPVKHKKKITEFEAE
jgi:hypothetical protein